MAYVPNELLSRLVGRTLYAVVFLKWYCQPGFDGALMNCDVWPQVDVGAGEIGYGSVGYRDALRSFLETPVVATQEATGICLVIEFASGIVRLHPTREELQGHEIAFLRGFEDGEWMCWRPREESFEDLA